MVAKALLFRKDTHFFDLIDLYIDLDILLREWRKKDIIGKFYNTIIFIRRTSQRREEFIRGEIKNKVGDKIKKGKKLIFN